MHKTLLAALISASVFALPALAQVSLGGAGHLGGSVAPNAGGAMNGAVRAPGQLGAPVAPGLPQTRHHVPRTAEHATGRADSTLGRNRKADVDARASGSARANAGGTSARANTAVNASTDVDAAAAGRAAGTARSVGDRVSDTAHAATDSTRRNAGTVGDAVRHSATESPVGADAKVRARADAHGH